MQRTLFLLSAAAMFIASSQFAFADGDGAVKGAVGGAVAGALVGGPVGAVVGAGAGAVVGGAATGPDGKRVVVVQPVVVQPVPTPPIEPCSLRTTQTSDSNGNS